MKEVIQEYNKSKTKDKDWEFWYYKISDNDYKELEEKESYLINWFSEHKYPNLNEKCEDISGRLFKNANRQSW